MCVFDLFPGCIWVVILELCVRFVWLTVPCPVTTASSLAHWQGWNASNHMDKGPLFTVFILLTLANKFSKCVYRIPTPRIWCLGCPRLGLPVEAILFLSVAVIAVLLCRVTITSIRYVLPCSIELFNFWKKFIVYREPPKTFSPIHFHIHEYCTITHSELF